MIDHQKIFCKHINQLSNRFRLIDVWSDFIICFACAISNSVDLKHGNERETLYLKTISKYSEKERFVFPQLVADTVEALEESIDQDFLGSVYMNLGLGQKSSGQFFTPYEICKLMSSITHCNLIDIVERNGWISINDCACGAGATLIASANEANRILANSDKKMNWQNYVLFTAQDIDMIAALMCYIQLSLIGAAGYVKIGNAISNPILSTENDENYWYTPMYFSSIWKTRRIIEHFNKLFEVKENE